MKGYIFTYIVGEIPLSSGDIISSVFYEDRYDVWQTTVELSESYGFKLSGEEVKLLMDNHQGITVIGKPYNQSTKPRLITLILKKCEIPE